MLCMCGFGEVFIGIIVGNGIDGVGEIECFEENDDFWLWLIIFGGFIGRVIEVGVFGVDGIGELIVIFGILLRIDWYFNLGGVGLWEEICCVGRLVLMWFVIFDGFLLL